MADWIDPQPVVVSDELRDAVGGLPLLAAALAQRGITTASTARAFLYPDYYTPSAATDFPDMDRAADRIWQALTTGERLAVWGDFDVDGQTSTALLVEALRKLSVAMEVQPSALPGYRVPMRKQGHGIFLPALDELLGQDITLLITCDTGVDAFAAIDRAKARGCDVIVTDHHELPSSLPPAFAVVNSKRLRPDHPLRELPGVGVAYKLVECLFEQAGRGDELGATLDLVALGIVADRATQVADVRYLLQRGLEALRSTSRVGLRALMDQAELRPDGLTEGHIGYQLGPRLNALGRLGDANRGVELLLTQDVAEARILAAEMDGLNYQRRLITSQVLQAALTQIERASSLLDYQALVVAGHNWHPGVLGLVAGHLAGRFERPAVVLSISDDGLARGSARSVPGCDIHAALKHTAHLLLRFGGHPGAAGLAIDPSNLEAFRKALSRSVAGEWDRAAASLDLQIDAYVSLDQLSLELVGQLERLAPFGPGNRAVQLASCDLVVSEDMTIGRDREHRRLVVADQHGTQQTVLWWQSADKPLPEDRFDLAYSLRARDYRGEMQLQVEWVDARPHVTASALPSRPARTIVDWRQKADPGRALAELSGGPIVIWVEGEDRDAWVATDDSDRLSLGSSSALAVWTAPPGPAELAYALEAVNPVVLYLIGADPETADFRPFVERLAGMVKHDLRVRNGQVSLGRLAAALGHREATVRVGLQWLAARGQVSVIESDEDTIRLRIGGEPSPDWQKLESHLRQLLGETAAYRRHFRLAAVEELGISD